MVTLVNLRAYWRFLRVTRQFLPLTVAYARDRRRFLLLGRSRRVGPAEQRERAEALLGSLLTLGPTFIKLGQLLSTRPDVLPPAYIDVLSRLQDDVPPAPWEEARTVVEGELGPVEDVFDEFDTDPISGASLGQVYVATYEDQRVAVKVRRPGVEPLVEADLRAIKWLLPLVLFFVDENRAFSMRNLADEFEETIHEEMDYEREARMLREIRANFEGDDRVLMPTVVEAVSGPRVLTMEYIGGTKITRVRALDRMGIDRSALAETLQRVYLQMLIEDGVFHADPHPGNLAVTEEGRIVFYDFGMSGHVESFVQDSIVDFYVAIARRDIDAILDTLIRMGTLSPRADRGVMSEVMELAIRDARGESVEQYRVQQIINQVEDTIYEFPLRMPRDLALVLRVATVVEGVCVTLDEDFDFIAVATSFLREHGYFEETVRKRVDEAGDQLRRSAGSVARVPPKLERVLDSIERGSFEIKTDIEDPDDVLDQLTRRIVYGLLVAVGGLSVALLYSSGEYLAAAVAGLLTLPVGVALYRSFRERGIRARPQFTRQSLREQRSRAEAAEAAEAETAGALAPGVEPELDATGAGPDGAREDGVGPPRDADAPAEPAGAGPDGEDGGTTGVGTAGAGERADGPARARDGSEASADAASDPRGPERVAGGGNPGDGPGTDRASGTSGEAGSGTTEKAGSDVFDEDGSDPDAEE